MAADPTYGSKVQMRQGGDVLAVGSGGTLDIESGGTLSIAGVALKIVRGTAALDGSNPTPIATGLTAITSATVSLQNTAAPGLGTSILTVGISGGTLNVYAWKPTSATDPTLIASTGTETFHYQVFGT